MEGFVGRGREGCWFGLAVFQAIVAEQLADVKFLMSRNGSGGCVAVVLDGEVPVGEPLIVQGDVFVAMGLERLDE